MGKSRRLCPQSSAICKLRNSVGPLRYFSVYQGGLCVPPVGSKTGNEDRGINSLCKQHLQGLQSPIWGCSPPGWKKKRRGKSQTGNAVKGDESRSIKRETFGLWSLAFKIMGIPPPHQIVIWGITAGLTLRCNHPRFQLHRGWKFQGLCKESSLGT